MIMKEKPEDFIVREIGKPNIGQGPYAYYLLEKRLLNTVDACKIVAEALCVPFKHINFAGAKDRNAVTSQYISILNGPKKGFRREKLSVEYLGNGSERINLGWLLGNEFEITVRDIDEVPKPIGKFLNLFDEQRFGKNNDNHLLGKLLIKKDFKKAAEKLALEHPNIKERLSMQPNDAIGALKALPKKTLMLYVHSYQSYLWNSVAVGIKGESLALPGFDMDEDTADLYKAILRDEGVSRMDFLIRQIPEISAVTGCRELYAPIYDLKIGELHPDDLHQGRSKILVSFRLNKGSYATLAIKALFGF
jgi:tRNA pseudouridine13 synthase